MKRRCEESVPLLGPYLDGELPEEDLVWLEEHLADCDPCTARKNLLIAQAEALRERAAARVRDVDLGSVADAVFARIDREGPRTAPPLSVWGLEMWGAHRAVLSAGAGVAVAGCLALALFLAPQRPSPVMIAQAQATGASIDEIDFENHEGIVMQNGATTTIWVDDDSPVQQ
ncbi:MAG: zf-HC2 domain-containing protein [Deltaproteobacteria bacterium]|nr:MAG: zf-HC2 domain-containing protein [Deltaproteobacteria bacterium]TMB31914.1 MAG: zf-HC2 domain-containing protein [Deltaproteobacteria bacterium]